MAFIKPIRPSPVALILLVFLLILTAITAHFWIADQRAVLRAFYPVKAFITGFQIECNANHPRWMKDLIRTFGNDAGGTSQLAYISPAGDLHRCERGWTGTIFRSDPVSPDSRFRYASTTKLLTAEATLSLVRDGHFQLDTPLAELFPELLPFADPKLEQVTIRMLLMHTGGFDRRVFSDPMFALNQQPWCPLEIGKLAELKLHAEPGESYLYSNLGYCLLGAAIERVSGQAYREFVGEKYDLPQYGIQFVDGPYLPDEVSYDFRYDGFYSDDYAKFFDFYSVSSSAGLSGSAKSLALLVKNLIQQEEPNLLSGAPLENCSLSLIKRCYGFSFYQYLHRETGRIFHLQEGYLPGSTSLVVVGDNGEIFVMLSASKIPGGLMNKERIYGEIISSLLTDGSP